MKIGVIGYGSIGQRHFKNLSEMGHSVIFHDPDADISAPLDLLFDKAEAIVVASPTALHRSHVLAIAAIGKPMLVEKPIGATNKDWIALKEMSRKDRIFVGYNLRFLNNVIEAKNLLYKAKKPPLWARFTCAQFNDKPVYIRDGVILNWSHEIDLALHLLGPAKVVSSYTLTKDRQDILTHITLKHDSGCISHIHLDYITKPQVRGFTIHGNGHGLTCDLERGTMLVDNKDRVILHEEGAFEDCYIREMEAFVIFASGGMMQGCTAEEALSVLDICLRVREQAGLEI